MSKKYKLKISKLNVSVSIKCYVGCFKRILKFLNVMFLFCNIDNNHAFSFRSFLQLNC